MTKEYWELVLSLAPAVTGVLTVVGIVAWPWLRKLFLRGLREEKAEFKEFVLDTFKPEVEEREATAQLAEETHSVVMALRETQQEQREELREHRKRLEGNIAEMAKMPDALHHLAESIKATAEIQRDFAKELKQTQLEVARLTPRSGV